MQLQLQLSHPRLQRSCRRAALLELLTLPAVQQVAARQAQPLDHGWSRVTIQQHLHRLPLKLLGKRPATPPPRQAPALDWPLAHPPTPSWLPSLRSPAVRQIGSTSLAHAPPPRSSLQRSNHEEPRTSIFGSHLAVELIDHR